MANLVINNFTRGQLDHDLNGRYDLPFYFNGFEVSRNFISNYKGNVKYRTGMEYVSKTRNNQEAVLMEFRFNTDQSYLLEFTEKKLRFYTYDANGEFGYVVDSNNNIIELDTGITLAQAKKLQKAQNSDVMYLVMSEINPQKLIRTSATTFTMEKAVPKGIDFTEVGYPSSVAFYSGRLWYGGFSKKPLSVYGSKTTEYEEFTIPESDIKDDDALKLTLSEITDPISWLMGGKNNLYVGNPEGMSLINGGGSETPITATEVNADLANHEGTSTAIPTRKDSQLFYISSDKRKVYMFDYDLLTEKFISTDLNWLAQEVTRDKLKAVYTKRDDNNNIYCLTESGQLLLLLYNTVENINGWFPCNTNGKIASMCTVTRPDGKDDLLCCVQRNGTWYIERVASEVEFTKFYESPNYLDDKKKTFYNRLIAEQLKECVYLDNASKYNAISKVKITYSNGVMTAASNTFTEKMVGHYIVFKTKTGKEYGTFEVVEYVSPTKVKVEVASDGCYPNSWSEWYISFNQITGLSDFNGKTVKVVADGGYLNDFVVTNGTINFDREVTSCVVGYGYTGLLKTFPLGSVQGGKNYQTSRKRIAEFVLRFVNSGGVNVGTDIYALQAVQQFSPTGFFDLPPLPMDGDEERHVPDNFEKSKSIFLTQDMPLPMNLTVIQYNIEFC